MPSFGEPPQSMGFTSGLSDSPSSGATSHIRKITQDHQQETLRDQGENYSCAKTIEMLPDNVLLEIFDFHRKDRSNSDHIVGKTVWKWRRLVHVCRRWRQIIFGSPHRLRLQITCTTKSPVKRYLDIWPAFPIMIDYGYLKCIGPSNEDNVIAALEHLDRVCFARLYVTASQLEKITMVMQKPSPKLTRLEIVSEHGRVPDLPADFLEGYAPCLQRLYLHCIPYPTLPTLLLSASDLVRLCLHEIPPTGYISPKALVASLAALPSLEKLIIGFQSATSHPHRIHTPPVTLAVLPALRFFEFRGASEYIEDLVARIDGPQLGHINIAYLVQLVELQVSQLSKFIDRSVGHRLTVCRHARVTFSTHEVSFTMFPFRDSGPASTTIKCAGVALQVSHMAQVLSHLSAPLYNVVHFKLYARTSDPHLTDTNDVQWLYLLRQFPTVKTLYVSGKLAGHVAHALEDITAEMVVDVLPSLDFIYLVDTPASCIEKFAAVRRLSGHPVIIVTTEKEYHKRFKSYIGD